MMNNQSLLNFQMRGCIRLKIVFQMSLFDLNQMVSECKAQPNSRLLYNKGYKAYLSTQTLILCK